MTIHRHVAITVKKDVRHARPRAHLVEEMSISENYQNQKDAYQKVTYDSMPQNKSSANKNRLSQGKKQKKEKKNYQHGGWYE